MCGMFRGGGSMLTCPGCVMQAPDTRMIGQIPLEDASVRVCEVKGRQWAFGETFRPGLLPQPAHSGFSADGVAVFHNPLLGTGARGTAGLTWCARLGQRL